MTRRSPTHQTRIVLATVGLCAVVASVIRMAVRGEPSGFRRVRGRLQGYVGRRRGALLNERRAVDVDEVVLADRVRSILGPLQKELDLPRLHVMAEGDRVLLHGEVDSEVNRERVEAAVRETVGVGSVGSYLRVGLLTGDSRPSSDHHDRNPSRMARHFHDALTGVGISGRPADLALAETIRLWGNVIPAGERAHLKAHLSKDVKSLMHSERHGRSNRVGDVAELIDQVRIRSGLAPAQAKQAVKTIVHELRTLVPEECDDITVVLPMELRPLWV